MDLWTSTRMYRVQYTRQKLQSHNRALNLL